MTSIPIPFKDVESSPWLHRCGDCGSWTDVWRVIFHSPECPVSKWIQAGGWARYHAIDEDPVPKEAA